MTEQPGGFGSQPQVLPPAIPQYMYPPAPPRRSRSIWRGVLTLLIVLGILAILLVGGLYALGSAFRFSEDGRIEELHYSGNRLSSHKIAIISVTDIIMESTARHVVRQLKAASEDAAVKAVVLKVDSPGGTINASDHIHRRVQQLTQDPKNPKPVVVSMQGLAASGGYYISAPANQIFAEPTTMTGSIGVIASFPNVSGLMESWKIQMEVVKTGPMKDAGSPFRPMKEEERQRWQEIIGDAFERFLDVVTQGRKGKLDRAKVRLLATGEVFTAKEARENGLIDEIGYLEDAIAAAEQRAGVTDSHVVEYRRPLTLSSLLFEETSARKRSLLIDLDSLYRANVPRVMYLTQGPAIGL